MKTKKTVSIMLLMMLIILTLLTGCMSSGKGGSLDLSPTVFTCGFYKPDGTVEHACYWEGQNRFDLQVVGTGSRANSIQYYKGVVYAGGITNGGSPCFWKNQSINLFPEMLGEVRAIFIYNDIEYSGGYIGGPGTTTPCYWEKDIIRNLDHTGYLYGRVQSIYIENNNIYCGGFISNAVAPPPFTPSPCYWINNTLYPITGDSGAEGIKSIYALNGTVYSCGTVDSAACFYENEDKKFDGGPLTYCNSMAVSGGVFYIGGQYWDSLKYVPCYWKGLELHPLAGGANNAYVTAITVFNGKVYAGGYYFDGSINHPCYWVDGQCYDLPAVGGDSVVNGIWVGYKQ